MIKYINNKKTKTILLLHGLACDISYFDTLIEIMGTEYNILLPKLFGHYKESKNDFTILEECENICEYCIINNITINIIIAHSMSSILSFYIDKKINSIENIYLLEGNIIEEDFGWSSQISSMTNNEFKKYWDKFQKQYPLILKMKLKNKLDLIKYTTTILDIDGCGIYQYARLISEYKENLNIFDSSFPKIIYFESNKSKYIDKKKILSKKYNFKLELIANTSHYMMIDVPNIISNAIKEKNDS